MIVKVVNILILVLLFVISFRVTKQLDFCQTFVDNNNTINYGYQHWSDGYYFFIDGNYWRLEHNSNGFKLLNRSAFMDKMNRNYRFVFSTKWCENNLDTECHNSNTSGTGLYWKWPSDDSLYWVHLKSNSSSGDLEVDTSVRDNLEGKTTPFKVDIYPMIAFQLISGPEICFLQKMRRSYEKGMNIYRTYRCGLFYKYSKDGFFPNVMVNDFQNRTDYIIANLKKVMDNQRITYDSDYTILNDINATNDCIAIFNVGDRYVFFYRHEKRIFYCFSSGALFNKECLSSQFQTLIDCSNSTKGMTTTTVSTEEPKVSDNGTDISTTEPSIETQFTSCETVSSFETQLSTQVPTYGYTTETPENDTGFWILFWIVLIGIDLIVIIIIVIFIVYKFVGLEKDDNNPKNGSQTPNEGNTSTPKEPVAPTTSQTPVKKESNEELSDSETIRSLA